jgi:hypothetical protein
MNSNALPTISLTAVMLGAVIATLISTQTIKLLSVEGQELPLAKCLYKGQEYLMNAHIASENQKLDHIDFPDLPDDNLPQLVVQEGERIRVEFDGDKPTEIKALLVDYDADVTETYPLEKINEGTFELTQTGIKTLEVIATFADDLQASYTLLVDVKPNI